MDPKIFITYSSKDQKVSRTICTALENRGLTCWISSRNVKPGHNYQEQIVRAIRAAKIMVLVFTANANNSNEIKKELSLASQNNLIVIPVRIEDVTPNEAFAYEFATRQWIDLFDDWENSIVRLVDQIAAILDDNQSSDQAKVELGSTAISAPTTVVNPIEAELTAAAVPELTRPRSGLLWGIICGVVLIAIPLVAYYVAIAPLKLEQCTKWDYQSGQLGTNNYCDRPVAISFIAYRDLRVVEGQIEPQERFNTGLDEDHARFGWIFAACRVGYVSDVPFLPGNWDKLVSSGYSCVRK